MIYVPNFYCVQTVDYLGAVLERDNIQYCIHRQHDHDTLWFIHVHCTLTCTIRHGFHGFQFSTVPRTYVITEHWKYVAPSKSHCFNLRFNNQNAFAERNAVFQLSFFKSIFQMRSFHTYCMHRHHTLLNDSFDLHLQKYQGKHWLRYYNNMAEIMKKGNNS